MLYDSDQRPAYRRKKIIWVSPRTLGVFFLFLALLLMLFYAVRDENNYKTPFERFISAPVVAFQKVRSLTTGFFSDLFENFSAKRELDAMQAKLRDLQLENGRLMYRLRRFEAYREALELPNEQELPTVPAIVITHDNRMTHSMIINRGTVDGLRVNMAVWTGYGLVGRTTPSLTEHRAKVQPITDPRSTIGVYIQDTGYEGVLKGTEEGEFLILSDLFRVGNQEEVHFPEAGQAVYTSGRGRVFPGNLLVGFISDATSEEDYSDDGYVVTPAVNINTVQSVLVIMNTKLQEETKQLLAEE
jgi:rod shape-determining protein MreC